VQTDRIELETHHALLKAKNLGEYACGSVCLLWNHGWDSMVCALRTNPDLQPTVQELVHPAAHVLDHLRCHGAPVVKRTPPWSRTRHDEAIARGSHQSAHQHLPFLEQKMLTMVGKGQWMILPYETVADIPILRISPLGVVPQCDRRPHTIADYTFSGVNNDTVPLTDHLPLQFGQALLRILQ